MPLLFPVGAAKIIFGVPRAGEAVLFNAVYVRVDSPAGRPVPGGEGEGDRQPEAGALQGERLKKEAVFTVRNIGVVGDHHAAGAVEVRDEKQHVSNLPVLPLCQPGVVVLPKDLGVSGGDAQAP